MESHPLSIYPLSSQATYMSPTFLLCCLLPSPLLQLSQKPLQTRERTWLPPRSLVFAHSTTPHVLQYDPQSSAPPRFWRRHICRQCRWTRRVMPQGGQCGWALKVTQRWIYLRSLSSFRLLVAEIQRLWVRRFRLQAKCGTVLVPYSI